MKMLFIGFLFVTAIAGYSQQAEKFIVNFDFDRYAITPSAKQKLDSFLRSAPVASIETISLYGHCDSVGNNIYNDRLSLERVDAVKKYLSRTIPKNVFENTKGYGKRQPLNNNAGEEERYLNRRVEVIVQKKELPAKNESPKKEQPLLEKIKDTTTKAGTNIILKNMNFFGASHRLLPQSLPVLRELLQTLQQYPSLEIEIQGHVCCVDGPGEGYDNDTQSYTLSVNRARAIHDFLIENNISGHRISYNGFGHRYPLFEEDTDEHRIQNRRVEIKIIKK